MATEFSVQEFSLVQPDYSGYSGYESGISAQQEQQNDDSKLFFLVCCFIFLSGLAALVVLLVGVVGDSEPDSEDITETVYMTVSSGGSGPPASIPSPPPSPPGPQQLATSATGPTSVTRVMTASTTTSTTTTSTTTTTTTTTTPPPPLLCSVDHTAVMKNVYPPDGLCDLLIYTHVRIDDTSKVVSINNQSYISFGEVCAGYGSTSCGLSFDARYAKNGTLQNQTAQANLRSLPPPMKHLAVMNIVERDYILTNISTLFGDPLKILSDIKGTDQTRKIIVGIGTIDYGHNAWTAIQNGIAGLLTSVPGIDFVVILTAFTTITNQQGCFALPVSAWDSSDPRTPTFVQALPVAQAAVNKPGVTVAIALQMGVVTYSMRMAAANVQEAIYKACMGALLGDMSTSCEVTAVDINPENVMGSVADLGSVSYFVVFDTTQTMMAKGMEVLNSPQLPDKFTWFLHNVHLTDFSGQCLASPFERVTNFKNFFQQQLVQRRG